jgi:hypothetical protein
MIVNVSGESCQQKGSTHSSPDQILTAGESTLVADKDVITVDRHDRVQQ